MANLETHLLDLVKNFLSAVGYPGVFLLMTIEGFGIPIPSELTMPFAGALTTSYGGFRFSLLPAVVVGAAGEWFGSTLAYYLGFYGGRPILDRYGRLVLLSPDELERAERWFGRYGDWVVLVSRLLPAVRSFIALPAGVVRMPYWRFAAYTALGSFLWCLVLVLIGHALGQHWNSVSTSLRKYDVLIFVAAAFLIVFGIYKRITAGRRASPQPATEL